MKFEFDEKDAKVALRRLEDDLRILQVIRGENWTEADVNSLHHITGIMRKTFEELKPIKKKKKES
jgi:hypothetical protein